MQDVWVTRSFGGSDGLSVQGLGRGGHMASVSVRESIVTCSRERAPTGLLRAVRAQGQLRMAPRTFGAGNHRRLARTPRTRHTKTRAPTSLSSALPYMQILSLRLLLAHCCLRCLVPPRIHTSPSPRHPSRPPEMFHGEMVMQCVDFLQNRFKLHQADASRLAYASEEEPR
jgi:hypothetical protein